MPMPCERYVDHDCGADNRSPLHEKRCRVDEVTLVTCTLIWQHCTSELVELREEMDRSLRFLFLPCLTMVSPKRRHE